uniref:Retrotransposon gag domain-containing protein n=1 Tax=Tanacetum cinerariifolium TaxID=118510 RepID=A0A6L2M2C5_TANCI|nr:hypothetical protein [Tanacetum cinerariifolium]
MVGTRNSSLEVQIDDTIKNRFIKVYGEIVVCNVYEEGILKRFRPVNEDPMAELKNLSGHMYALKVSPYEEESELEEHEVEQFEVNDFTEGRHKLLMSECYPHDHNIPHISLNALSDIYTAKELGCKLSKTYPLMVTVAGGNKLLRITSITVNGKNAYELKGKFLDDLHKNAFTGTNGEDAVEHIKYFLKIVDLIDLPNVNQDKLRVVLFPISLVGDAWRWFDGIKGSITSWVDLTDNFFRKYYPSFRTGKVDTPIIKWDPTNPKFENCDEIKPTNNETSDLEETDHDDEQEIDPDLLTKDIEGFMTYEEFKDDWIYEWNKDVPWDYEWYEALEDGELKEEALRNKAIMEGIIDDDDESSYERWNVYNDTNHDHGYEMDHEIDERQEICSNETHELPVCNIKIFEMIKYSFIDDKEYVVVKEYEYEDLTDISKDACRAYQEIFRMMDEGWMVTRAE